MKETFFFSSEMYFFSPLRWGIVSLACPGHMKSQCSLVDGSWGSIILCCHSTEMCTCRCYGPLILPRLMKAVNQPGSSWILLFPMVILSWIPAESFHATEKVFLYYYSVNRVDYYAIRIKLILPFPGDNIFLP